MLRWQPLPPLQRSGLAAVAVRRYNPAQDHADVVHICRDVYGGADDLPDTINASLDEPGTHIIVAAMGGQQAPLDSLLCCQQQGDVLWLWGARTREEQRGNGLAHLLLEEAESLARRLPGVMALLSVTVPNNLVMRRLFERRGLRQQCEVVIWPTFDASLAAHKQLSQQGPPSQVYGSQQQLNMLSVYPEAAAVVNSPAAQQLLPRWRRCKSQAELSTALVRLRHHRTHGQQRAVMSGSHSAQHQQQEHQEQQQQQPCDTLPAYVVSPAQAAASLDEGSHAFNWLPAEYKVVPAGWPAVEERIQQGHVWLLDDAAPYSTAAEHTSPTALSAAADIPAVPAAILVVWGPGHMDIHHAGIVAGSMAAVESAVLCAASVDPSCCRLYVDCCDRFTHEELWSSTGSSRFLPYHKAL